MKDRTLLINAVLIIVLLVFFFIGLNSCSNAKHIGSETEVITVRDTAHFDTTIIVDGVSIDTLLNINSFQDTVYIVQEKLKIKTVIKNNQVFIEGRCDPDTIQIFKEIPVETEIEVIKEVYRYPTFWESNRIWLIPLVILAILGIIAKKLKLI